MRVIKLIKYAPELVPLLYDRDQTRVQMFYFLKIEHYNRYIKVNKINNCTHIDCVHSEKRSLFVSLL
mgnify:CR=1 FL=1